MTGTAVPRSIASNWPLACSTGTTGNRRDLPWRARPGEVADPYRVWLSEIMLQQTTVATVAPYFRAFLARWPSVDDLAAADLDEVLHAWQGLGYYARARNLHKCARVVVEQLGSRFPDSEEGLRALPGIGPYTAAAIAAIAFDRPATVVDGNVERVVARLFAHEEPLPAAKPALRALTARLTPSHRPGDFAQAMMDLGATVCAPKAARCQTCPWASACLAHARGIELRLPARQRKKARPTRYAVAFWLVRGGREVLLRRRPDSGLLGGMIEVPTTPWRDGEPWRWDEALAHAPGEADWRPLGGSVRHTFTHFHFEADVMAANLAASATSVGEGNWWPIDQLDQAALPTVMKKIIGHALDGAPGLGL